MTRSSKRNKFVNERDPEEINKELKNSSTTSEDTSKGNEKQINDKKDNEEDPNAIGNSDEPKDDSNKLSDTTQLDKGKQASTPKKGDSKGSKINKKLSSSKNKDQSESKKKTERRSRNRSRSRSRSMSRSKERFKFASDRSIHDESPEFTDSESSSESEISQSESDGELTDIELSVNNTESNSSSDGQVDDSPPRKKKRHKKRSRRSRSRSASRTRSEKSSAKEMKRRKQKRRIDSDSEDEKMRKIIKMVKEELRKETKSDKKKKGKQLKFLSPSKLVASKSASNSTIYTPALDMNESPRQIAKDKNDRDSESMINNFLSNMRLITGSDNTDDRSSRLTDPVRKTRNEGACGYSPKVSSPAKRKNPKEVAEEVIMQADRTKATILPNPGNEDILDRVDPNNMNHLIDDGNFLHMTCHVEPALRAKIQRGEYVDLAKLLLKPKMLRKFNSEERLNLINKDGNAVLVSQEQSVQINNIRMWEQAFRIYATIYSQANPHRASEILQYINVITNAAKSYMWDCVAYYDYTFRQMMQRKPNRSWSNIFPQLWSVAMTEPISRSNNVANNQSGKKKDWRDGCCWKFNKSYCPYGKSCRFEHRCTYCGSYGHPVSKCEKKGKRSSEADRDHRSQHSDRKRGRDNQNRQHSKRSRSKTPDPSPHKE